MKYRTYNTLYSMNTSNAYSYKEKNECTAAACTQVHSNSLYAVAQKILGQKDAIVKYE